MQTAKNNLRLLIVEDNKSLRQMLTWEFEDLGYRVSAVDCCSKAIDQAMQAAFDVALLDHNLPDGCGTDLIQQLHKQQPELSIIVISGRQPNGCTELGAYCFLPKPVRAAQIHRLFQQALAAKQHDRA